MSLFRIWLLARKETWHILRDMRTVYMAFGIPLVLLLLFGWALTTDVDQVPLVVVDWDRSAVSRELVRGLENARSFQVVDRPDSPAGIETVFHRGGASAALVIPAGFEADLERGDEATLQLIADGTNANDAAIAMAFAQAQTQALSLKVIREAMARRGMAVKGAFRPPDKLIALLKGKFNGEQKRTRIH